MKNAISKAALPKWARPALLLGGIAALLASTCCLGPLVLLLLGISGAWIARLTALEPYRPWLIGVALVAVFFAWRSLWGSSDRCVDGVVCASPVLQRRYKQYFGIVVVLVLTAIGFPLVASWFY